MVESPSLTAPILFLAPFPGPVTGQTMSSQALFGLLAQKFGKRLVQVDISRGTGSGKAFNNVVKVARAIRATIRIATTGRKESWCYVSVDANLGMAQTLAFCIAARLRGCRIILHHHTNAHVSSTRKLMGAVVKVSGRNAVHLTICQLMSDELRARYFGVANTLELSNIFHIEHRPGVKANPLGRRRLTLGHMSKLSVEKGVVTCIETHRALLSSGIDSRLLLAGRFADARIERLVKKAQRDLAGIEILGEVSGESKRGFFSEIDVFLFPTEYRNETQGIVNLEALAACKPVFVIAKSCMRSDFASRPDWQFADAGAFAKGAADIARRMISEERRLEESRKAEELFLQLKSAAAEQLDSLADVLAGVRPTSEVRETS